MLALQLIKDTRDMVFYPSKGVFAKVNFGPSLKIIGADRNFINFAFDLSEYKTLTRKTILASNQFLNLNFGNVPFNQMALLGGAKKMRGLYYAYFRDKNALIIQEEVRRELGKIFGIVAFGSVGFMGDESDFIRFYKPKYAYGLGLRIATKKHLNLRVDYGFSPYDKPNLYLTIGEAF
jgi:outer membrane protein assembly factor BamA